jgi:uncharacterized protein YpbB
LVLEKDTEFKARSESAEDAFVHMEEEELLGMHTQFIKASGGNIESDDSWREKEVSKKKSTYDITKQFVLDGQTLEAIADARDMKYNTVVEHLEKLITKGAVALKDIQYLKDGDEDKKVMLAELDALFEEYGVERLKPVYEAAEERYSYDHIRLARLFAMAQ